MSKKNPDPQATNNSARLSRRHFLAAGGAAALAAAAGCAGDKPGVETGAAEVAEAALGEAKINRYRTLGRTGFQVSDVSMGCGSIADPNVVRYAYDHGINLFDTAESYGNGDSETKIGNAMQFMERDKIFIVSKMAIPDDPDEQAILDRFGKCLERLQTPYIDAFYMHSITDVTKLDYAPFHAACDKLKAEGKLKHVGVSSHGPRGDEPDSMDKVLCAAAEDGRFDVMLLSYGFINAEEGGRVLQSCKENNVGTTIMKSMTGMLEMPVYDIENPNEEIQGWYETLAARGMTRDEATERIVAFLERQMPEFEKGVELAKPFVEKHGVKSQDELNIKSLQWVLRNPDAHCIVPSMPNFDMLDKFIPLSGTELSSAGARFLDEYATAFGARNCRFGCTDCVEACPEKLPVSTIARYAYYYSQQGREKHAMRKYAKLDASAAPCLECAGHCTAACPHGVLAQAKMFEAHGRLTLA